MGFPTFYINKQVKLSNNNLLTQCDIRTEL